MEAQKALRTAYAAYLAALQQSNTAHNLADTRRSVIADCNAKLVELQPVKKGAKVIN